MSVEEEMQTLLNTKGNIRQALINKNVTVSETEPFRNYANKIAAIANIEIREADYVFSNTTSEASFPREPLTESYAGYFYGTSDETLSSLKNYLENGNEVAYWGGYENSWNVLQNSETWDGSPSVNGNQAFCFAEPVIPVSFHSRIGSTGWSLRATNDWNVFKAYLTQGTSAENMVTLIDDGTSTDVVGGVDIAVGDGATAYKYYVFNHLQVYSNIYNMWLNVITGNVRCTLSSANMTPSIKAYPSDYMRIITQPWQNGGNYIDSQELIFKPQADGGNTVNYDDDGKEVLMGLYLQDDGSYLLSPSEISGEKVGTLFIPDHLYPTEVIRTFEQPVLTANGTLGGNGFAVSADSVYGSREAWKAFDGITERSSSEDQWHSGYGQPHWIAFYNPTPLEVTKITVFNGDGNVLPLDWEFQCSDDNSEWTTIASGTNTELYAGAEWSFDISPENQGWHKYYRFYTTSGSGTDSEYVGLTELRITAVQKDRSWEMGGK